MIAIVDMNRTVRHECFHALTTASVPVEVFYSTLRFVDSPALHKANLLILGKTHDCKTQCKSLLWAASLRPNLDTLLLDPHDLRVRPLIEICNETISHTSHNDPGHSLTAFQKARTAGMIPTYTSEPDSKVIAINNLDRKVSFSGVTGPSFRSMYRQQFSITLPRERVV